MAQTQDVHCTLYTYSNELAPDHLLGSVHWTLDTVQLASVMVCSVHTYKDAFKPQALGHQWTLSNQLRPLPQELFCCKMHYAVILIMCIPNSSKDHISPHPGQFFCIKG